MNLLPASMVEGMPLNITPRKLYVANGSEISVKEEITINVNFI